jgi:dTDP-4-amino-4,6-dideoxygalactose transaminase
MKVRFFDPGKGYKKIRKEVLKEVDRVLTAGDLILRADVEQFEKTLAEYVGTKYAVALNSGTDALYLALMALGVKQGDRVLVPAHTFVATAQVVNQLGATPVLYDLGSWDGQLEGIKTVICAHIAGEFDWIFESLLKAANEAGIPLVEDACQALGAVKNGKKAGSFGVAGCFSFYPAKILGGYGDAGGLVTDDENLANEVRELRNHYKKDYSKWGINSRLDNVQAAILNIKFKNHNIALISRAWIAEKYKALEGVVGLPNYTEGRVWQDYVIRTEKRDALYDFLKSKGVETMKNEYHFPIPKPPVSVKYEAETLRLPCNENITEKEVQYVIDCVKEFYANPMQ